MQVDTGNVITLIPRNFSKNGQNEIKNYEAIQRN